jgi:hypothetical protein
LNCYDGNHNNCSNKSKFHRAGQHFGCASGYRYRYGKHNSGGEREDACKNRLTHR